MYIYKLSQIIERAAEQRPDQIAFKFLDQKISFKEVQHKSTQLAIKLQEQGVQKGDRLGIYMPRCIETTIAVYGILKLGAIYVPLDPFSPVERTVSVVKDCNIKHIVSIARQVKKLEKLVALTDINVVLGVNKEIPDCKTISWEVIFKNTTTSFEAPNILGDDLAYILYTSGSTGRPKGIMHTHASALAFVQLATDLYKMQDEIYGMHAPLHFDPSVQGYFGGPYAFAKTIIVSDAHTKMPASLAELIEKEKITIWFSVPLALIQMLRDGGLEYRDMSSLKWVLFSGEVFPTKHLRSLMLQWSFANFSNIYGPTETNQCTYYHIATPPETDLSIPIGSIWGNTDYKIINAQNKEVISGKAGELIIRTATMMKGYWNNPELTQKSLFIETNAVGLEDVYYRSGDQVKLDQEGRLLFLGRNDSQIKLRGYRIELGEIENVLNTHSCVQETVALIVRNEIIDKKELFTLIIASENVALDPEDVKKFCQKKLPIYAVPDHIQFLKKFPRTASGKINRKQLEKMIIAL